MEKQKYLEALNFFKERRAKMQKELENDANTATQKEIIRINIAMDEHSIKVLEEYIARL